MLVVQWGNSSLMQLLSFNREITMLVWWKRLPCWCRCRETDSFNNNKEQGETTSTAECFVLSPNTHLTHFSCTFPNTLQHIRDNRPVTCCVCFPLTGCFRQQRGCDPGQPSSNRFPLRRFAPCSRLFIVRACQSFPVKNHCRYQNIQPHSPGWHFRQWITGWWVTREARRMQHSMHLHQNKRTCVVVLIF